MLYSPLRGRVGKTGYSVAFKSDALYLNKDFSVIRFNIEIETGVFILTFRFNKRNFSEKSVFFERISAKNPVLKKRAEKRRKPKRMGNRLCSFLKSANKFACRKISVFTIAAMLFTNKAAVLQTMDLRSLNFFTDPTFRFLFKLCKNPFAIAFRKLRPNCFLKFRAICVPAIKTMLNASVRKNCAFNIFHWLLAMRANDLRANGRPLLGSKLQKVFFPKNLFRLLPCFRRNSAVNPKVLRLPFAIAGIDPNNKVAISHSNAGIFVSAFSASRCKTVKKAEEFVRLLFENFQNVPSNP